MQTSIPILCTSHRELAQSHKLNRCNCPKTTCALLTFGDAIIIPRTSVLSRLSAQIKNSGWFWMSLCKISHMEHKITWMSVCVLEVLGTKMQQVETILEIVTLSQLKTNHCKPLESCIAANWAAASKKWELRKAELEAEKSGIIEVLIHAPANGVSCMGPGVWLQ